MSPILLIICILIINTMGVPVFFTQERPGKNGKIFNTYSSLTKPTSKKITKDIEKILNIK